MKDQTFTFRELTIFLKLLGKTVYSLASEGEFPSFKVGGSWRFKREDIDVWFDSKKVKA